MEYIVERRQVPAMAEVHSIYDQVKEQAEVEIAALERARFIDRLDPEDEQAWAELVTLSKEIDTVIEDIMTPVWMDESLPNVFRDRAMLLVVGTESVRRRLGVEGYRANGSFALYGVSVGVYESVTKGFDTAKFCEWAREMWEYQRQTGACLVDGYSLLKWHYAFLERGLIDATTLDDFVAAIDIRTSSPAYEGSGWDGDSDQLDEHRFPLLSDILHARMTPRSAERVRTWALDKLDDWLEYLKDESVDIPDWLAATPLSAGEALFSELIYGGNKPDWLGSDIVGRAVDQIGLSILSRNIRSFNLDTVASIEDPRFKEMFLKALLYEHNKETNTSQGYRSIKGSTRIEDIQAIVDQSADEELKYLWNLEQERVAVAEEQHRQWYEELHLRTEAEKQASPKYQKQQLARAAFAGYVAGLAIYSTEAKD